MITKPMLAGKCDDTAKLRYPVLVSPKLDGIRCIVKPQGEVLSRKFLDIPNRFIRETLQDLTADLKGIQLDGELMVGEIFHACTSGIMSRAGEPDFVYHVFDGIDEDPNVPSGTVFPFSERLEWVSDIVDQLGTDRIKVIPHWMANSEEQLLDFEARFLADGHEGLMVRDPAGPYKCGRSTTKQGWLLKVKRFVDAEAQVLGFEELMHNANEATIDELGHTKRSSAKAGKVPMGTLGKFLVRDLRDGTEFRIGTGRGLTQALRQSIWDDRENYVGRIVKFRYQAIGVKDKPRIPVWLGFRDPSDL